MTFCRRRASIGGGKRSATTLMLEEMGCQIMQVADGPLDLGPGGVVWLKANANWSPVVCRQLAKRPRDERLSLSSGTASRCRRTELEG